MATSAVPRAVGPAAFRHRIQPTVGAIVELVREDDANLRNMLDTNFHAAPGVLSAEPLGYLKLADQKDNWGSQ